MKKVLLFVVSLLFVAGWAKAQVIADFETDAGGFSNTNWAPMVTSVARAADPTGKSSGVLSVGIDGTLADHGAIVKSGVAVGSAQVITYYVYLPADIPDDFDCQIWGQPQGGNWPWTQQDYYAKDIPKGVWYPLSYYANQQALNNPDVNVIYSAGTPIQGGFQFVRGASNPNWKGTILIDNVSLIGALPVTIADFESDLSGYTILNWSDGLSNLARVADPTGKSSGALDMTCTSNAAGNNSALINKTNIGPQSASVTELVYWVYCPADMPSTVDFTIFCQDNKNWNHTVQTTSAASIVKGKWFPIYFDLKAWEAKKSTFDVVNNAFGWFGLQVDMKGWSGDILIDNVGFLSDIVERKWVAVDFETPAAGLNGFYIASNQKTFTAISRIKDPTDAANKNHVIDAAVDLSLGTSGAIAMDNAYIYNSTDGKYAAKISLDVYIPSDFPSGSTVSLGLKGLATDNQLLTGEGNTVKAGQWNTVVLTTKPLVDAGLFNPQKTTSILAQVQFNSTKTWKGDLLFDNLTYYDINPILKALASPVTIAQVKSSAEDGAKVPFDYILIQWIDNLSGKETYNIYVSESPITNRFAKGVVKVASGIPHGQLAWAYRPYTSDGAVKTYYIAVTASISGETDLADQAKAGPLTLKTSKTVKVQYVPNFADNFNLDGIDAEFLGYENNQATPELGGAARPWYPGDTDFDYRATFVIDDNYLYMATNITDDEPNMASGLPGWSSDMEYFFGFYNMAGANTFPAHGISNSTSDGNWRIGIAPNGELETGGSNNGMTIPGVVAKTYEWPQKNGWTVEARFDLKALGKGGSFTVANGELLPFRIDGSDNDPSKGDGTNRGCFAQVNGWGNITVDGVQMDHNWERPSTFGFLEVTGVTDVAGQNNLVPTSFALYNNYPNPFNPTTKIKYDLPKEAKVTLKVYDILGREVTTLVDTKQNAGYYEVNFDATRLASGVYIYRLMAGDFVQTKKMILMK